MKENIVKNGVISFAPDDESTNILGTSNYEFNGTTHYDMDDQKEGDVQERGEDFELVPTKFIDIKLNDGTPTTDRVARVENTFSISKVFYGEIFQSLRMEFTTSYQQWY